MIRKLIVLFVIIFLSISIKAQTYYGFKVGANFANFYGDIDNNTIKPSFHVGALAEIIIDDFYSVQPELLFSMQGAQDKDDSNIKYNYHYATLPIMVKYFVSDFISVDAGAQVAYLLTAYRSNGFEEYDYLTDTSNRLDYGINVGGTYEFDNGMNAAIRYNYNLANIHKDVSDVDLDLRDNNAVIQISMGYKFY